MGLVAFIGLTALVWLPLRRMDSIGAKHLSDRRGERRTGELEEDGRFIMLPAFLVGLGYGVSVRAGRSQ